MFGAFVVFADPFDGDVVSAALIQGMTLAGVLFDEAALMPRSFVEQASARCSVEGSRLWFSCNPEGPNHWFYQEWVCRAKVFSVPVMNNSDESANPCASGSGCIWSRR